MPDPIDRLNEALAGRYSIERQLGEGGMATVYLARDERHDRAVAIKVLKPELAAVLGAERFLAEIKTTANLQHPHILPLHDSGEADGFLFYVMPYVEGESLRERLDRETQLPIDEAVSITRKVASALQAAHDQGVVHRDIKPANILLAAGEPLVADFGIALAVQQAGGGRLTETGLSLGTPHYMSPEQATAERPPDARSDVYSLGCVLYEMLTGEPPFTGPTAQAIVARLLSADPAPVTELRKTVPPHVAAAAQTALEKLPADRFASTAELARALAGEATATGSGGHRRAETTPTGRRGSATYVPWAIAGAAVLALAASLLTRGSADDAPGRSPRSVRVTLPPLDPPLRGGLAFSRDGSQIVYVGGRPLEPNRLWVRSLSDPEIRALPGTENPEGVGVSWDGRWAAFWADSAIRKISLDGGAPLTMLRTSNLPRGIAWTEPGDVVLGMLSGSGPHGKSGLSLLRDEASAQPDSLTAGGGMHHNPIPLEGGHVLFQRVGGGRVEIAVGSLETGQWEVVGLAGSPVGVANGILLYEMGGGGERNLMAVRWDADARHPVGESVVVPGIPSDISQVALSADGTLVFTRARNQYEVVLEDPGGESRTIQPGEIVSEIFPRFSPDGRTVALGADFRGIADVWLFDLPASTLTPLGFGFDVHTLAWTRGGDEVRAAPPRVETVWTRPADGSAEATVDFEIPETLWGNRGIMGVDTSPDGGTFALVKNVSEVFGASTYDITLVSRSDPETEVPFATGPADQRFPRFSPDGEWIAYTSNESGQFEIHIRAVGSAGARRQVSNGGGRQPVWSQDGSRLYYWVGDRLVVVDLSDADPARLEFGPERVVLQGSYFRGGDRAVLATYDVSPDGSQIVLARSVGDLGSITVWIDWMHELQDLFATRD